MGGRFRLRYTAAFALAVALASTVLLTLRPVSETRGSPHTEPGRTTSASPSAPASPSHSAPHTPPSALPTGNPLTFLTANIPFTLTEQRAVEELRHVLTPQADVVVLNEVRDRPVARLVEQIAPGAWTTYQPRGRDQSAVLWRTARFERGRTGDALGFTGRGYDRWMLWAQLTDRTTGRRFAVVGLHLPTNSSKRAGMRAYYLTMTANYRALARRLQAFGDPLVMGGDWNHPLDKPRESWSPVPMLREESLTTNWLWGRPCRGTSSRLGRIDGFAMSPQILLQRQGCLSRQHSDHRAVWMDVVLPAAISG